MEDQKCRQPATWLVRETKGAWDEMLYVCADHYEAVKPMFTRPVYERPCNAPECNWFPGIALPSQDAGLRSGT